MKARFDKITYSRSVETKRGLRHQFKVKFKDDKGVEREGTFLSPDKEQTQFREGEENEFTLREKEYNGTIYYNIYPAKKASKSNFARALKREQSKYSGFAMSYAKDLVCDGKIPHSDMFDEAEKMFKWMVKKDKELENGQ